MKNPQGAAAIECGMVVERCPPKPEQGDLLNDLAHGVLIVAGRLRLLSVNETGECGMDHDEEGDLLKNRAKWRTEGRW